MVGRGKRLKETRDSSTANSASGSSSTTSTATSNATSSAASNATSSAASNATSSAASTSASTSTSTAVSYTATVTTVSAGKSFPLSTDRHSPSSLTVKMLERQQLLRDQCLKKPPNPSFIEEADFTRFIVIEKLKVVFCFIPKVACTTWKRLLYSAENLGKKLRINPHSKTTLFRWLKDYTPAKRREILDTYYKAMFVRDPFERLASAYRDKVGTRWFRNKFFPENKTLGKTPQITFSTFIRRELLTNKKTTLKTNHHWRSYEQICPCEVNYDFIGHFENLVEEATQLLKIIGVNDYVVFPEYRPSKPYMLEYYSQLKKDEIFRLGEIFQLDFKLFGYDIPGSLKVVLKNKTIAEKSHRDTP